MNPWGILSMAGKNEDEYFKKKLDLIAEIEAEEKAPREELDAEEAGAQKSEGIIKHGR